MMDSLNRSLERDSVEGYARCGVPLGVTQGRKVVDGYHQRTPATLGWQEVIQSVEYIHGSYKCFDTQGVATSHPSQPIHESPHRPRRGHDCRRQGEAPRSQVGRPARAPEEKGMSIQETHKRSEEKFGVHRDTASRPKHAGIKPDAHHHPAPSQKSVKRPTHHMAATF
jgi:hypothetical protein